MKHLYSLFILFPLFSFAQLHVIVGAQKGMEWEHHYSNEEGVFTAKNLLTPTLKSEFWTDHYSAGVSFLDQKVWYSFSLSYLYNSYNISSRHYEDGNGKYYTKWSDYSLDLKYAYLGVGFRVEGVLNCSNKTFNVLVGGNLFLDFNVMSSMSNQTRTSFKKYVNSDEPIVVGPYSDSENMEGMVDQAGVFSSLGPVVTFRLNLKSIFIDVPIGVGLKFMKRAEISPDFGGEYSGHGIGYFNYGIRLGYKINSKD